AHTAFAEDALDAIAAHLGADHAGILRQEGPNTSAMFGPSFSVTPRCHSSIWTARRLQDGLSSRCSGSSACRLDFAVRSSDTQSTCVTSEILEVPTFPFRQGQPRLTKLSAQR